ncbi:MAG: metalloregulator ArsR/SmtB family transcription factor [Chloroflexota bacterium]|nr:metalloregulator ArsR/SmtB family transcription factor [Chloroflexota bacterium]
MDIQITENNFQEMTEEVIETMAESFKALADPTRLRILALLFTAERSVSYLAENLSVSQSAVSHQLRLLRTLDIVRYRKEGREVFYTLADDHVREILMLTLEHILYD